MESRDRRTTILAHRGNVNGPDTSRENTVAHCAHALSLDVGLELDLRRAGDGRFYFSHDAGAISDVNSLDCFSAILRRYPRAKTAINIKENLRADELIRFERRYMHNVDNFYFDFELLDPMGHGRAQRAIRAAPGGFAIRLAARISDRGETMESCLSVPANIVWADEFDDDWLTQSEIDAAHAAERLVFAVSPELHGRADPKRRWEQFKAWGVDGVCTDLACDADEFFND